MTLDRCFRCGRPIRLGQWFIDVDDDHTRHERCPPRRPGVQLTLPGVPINTRTSYYAARRKKGLPS